MVPQVPTASVVRVRCVTYMSDVSEKLLLRSIADPATVQRQTKVAYVNISEL